MEFLDQRQAPTFSLFRSFSSTFHHHPRGFLRFFFDTVVISRKPLSFNFLFFSLSLRISTLLPPYIFSFAVGYSEIQGETVTDSEIIRGRDRICRSREIYGTTVLARA